MRTIHRFLKSLRRTPPWRRETPTTSIYFATILADLIADEARPQAPIERLEPNVFRLRAKPGTTVVIRYASPALIGRLCAGLDGPLVYLIDDDVLSPAVFAASHLPADYLQRLSRFAEREARPLMGRASDIVAPSRAILDGLDGLDAVHGASGPRRHLIHPAPTMPFPGDLDHFAAADNGKLSMVFNATRSHLGDLALIAEPLRAVLDAHPHIRLTTFLGQHAPAVLRHPKAEHRPPLGWSDYRRLLAAERFHIALAPARDTAFNRARSASRILDNACFGAAAVHSAHPPFGGWLEDGRDAVLVDDSPEAWFDALNALATDPARMKALAGGLQTTARRIGDPAALRAFWLTLLGLPR